MSLVLELQRLALDPNTDVSELLKKAYAVAFKLNLRSFKTWTECELNGYVGKKLPPYRMIHGRVVCLNPVRGWIPFYFRSPESQATASSRWLNTTVGLLQEFLRSGHESSIIDFDPDLEHLLMQGMVVPMRPALEVPVTAYVHILETVRNTILKWSLKLEQDNILGEGMTFSLQEKKTAEEKAADLRPPLTVNLFNNNLNVGQMDRSAVQQASPQAEMYFDPDEPAP
jgi:hypothetical protein